MVIHNNSDKFITCVFNHSAITLAPKDSFDCDEKFDSVSFSIVDESYSVLQAKKSKFLKFLSFWDDPFKLIKEYHLTVVSSYTKGQLANYRHIILTAHSCYADIETRTYYNFVKVMSGNVSIVADDMEIFCKDEITNDFVDNNRKLVRWQSVWDIILEPVFFEIIGYWAIYRLFSVWFEIRALLIVFFILGLNVIVDSILFLFKRRGLSKRYNKFLDLCCNTTIKKSIM